MAGGALQPQQQPSGRQPLIRPDQLLHRRKPIHARATASRAPQPVRRQARQRSAVRIGVSDAPVLAMTKSNVNPNHYKVAGRDRQGEGILQERHKQKHAQSLARKRFEQTTLSHVTPGPAGALAPGPPPGPSRESAASEASSTRASQAPPTKDKARKPASTARRPAAAAVTKKVPRTRAGTGATTGAKRSAKKRAAPRAARKPSSGAQASDKRGKRSTAQKRASSRNDFDSMPATRPVAGAFGKEPSARRRAKRPGRA